MDWRSITVDGAGGIKIKGSHGFTPWASNLFPYRKGGSGKYDNAPALKIVYNDRIFTSVETAYQAAKALFYDQRIRAKFPGSSTSSSTNLFSLFPPDMGPMDAKSAAGKKGFASAIHKILGFAPYVSLGATKKRAGEIYDEILKKDEINWYGASIGIMSSLIDQKFSDQNPEFRDLLLSTGTANIYEQKFRGGSLWEKGGSPSGFGVLGDLIMARRKSLREREGPRYGEPVYKKMRIASLHLFK